MEKILVSDVMTREPVTISPETNLLDCAKKMIKKRVGSLLLVDNRKLKGIITNEDILWALVKKTKADLSKITAKQIANKKISTIKPTATMQEAFGKMKSLKFRRLPVVAGGELVGVVTIKDILNVNPEFYPEFEEFAKIREESEKLKRVKAAKERTSFNQGVCEECGNFDFLYKIDGKLMCETCKECI